MQLRILWHNLHMFLYILELEIENWKNYLVKTVLKLWSKKFTKMAFVVPIIRQRLGMLLCLLVVSFFLVLRLFSKSSFMDTSAFLWQIWDHIFKTDFCNLYFKMSRNMCTWHHKVCNGSILPIWSQNFQNNFLKVYLQTIKAIFHKSETS